MKSKITSLSKNIEFKSLLNGKKISNKYSTIFFKRLNNKNFKKLNVSFVAKKKLGNAVVRNRIKRRLQSVIRKNLQNKKNINTDYSYLVFGKSKAYNEKYSIIEEEFDKTFYKINTSKN